MRKITHGFDIFNSNSREVICVDNKDHSWSFNDNASKFLIVGNIYNVTDVDVHSFHTRVKVREYPNQWFNSVAFEETT
jgi:hypothetical protein